MRLKHLHLMLFLLPFVACNSTADSPSEAIKNKLSGTWALEGKFNDEIPQFDTLFTEHPNTSSDSNTVIYGISTDTGTFNHIYSLATSELLEIVKNRELELVNFIFDDDHSGRPSTLIFNPDNPNGLSDAGFTQRIELKEHDRTLILVEQNGSQTTIEISSIDHQILVLKWNGNYSESFKKFSPPGSL